MTKVQEQDKSENPFNKILDDAGRSLKDFGDLDFLDELPNSSELDNTSIPFPYGPQPEGRQHWKR